MSRPQKIQVGDRVALVGKHPWVGYSGEVIDKQEMTGVLTVRLDDGWECMAWPRQYRRFES